MNQYIDIPHLIYAVLILFFGFGLGILIERLIFPWIARVTSKSKSTFDDVALKAIRGKVIFITTIAALHYGVIGMIHLDKRVHELADNAIIVLSMVIITLIVRDLIAGLIFAYANIQKGSIHSTSIFINFSSMLIFFIGFILILKILNLPIQPIWTTMGLGGLAVALALQDTLTNLFSGLQIVLSKKLAPGDYVRLNSGEEGYVQDIAWRNTTLITLTNNTIVVPNSKLGTSIVTNYKLLDKQIFFEVNIGISYDSNLEKVEEVTKEVASSVMFNFHQLEKYEPFFFYHTFNEYSIDFRVRLMCYNYKDSLDIKHAFIKLLHKRFREEGIEIPFPIRTLVAKPDMEILPTFKTSN